MHLQHCCLLVVVEFYGAWIILEESPAILYGTVVNDFLSAQIYLNIATNLYVERTSDLCALVAWVDLLAQVGVPSD
jgi:hypothetical protein